VQGKLDLKTCPGRGSQEAKNGVGGVGKNACLRPQTEFGVPRWDSKTQTANNQAYIVVPGSILKPFKQSQTTTVLIIINRTI